MGVEPITATVGLAVVAVGALALYLEECEREKERSRRQEEDSRRWRREAREKEKVERRRQREAERERKEQERREERMRREWAIIRSQEEEEEQRRHRSHAISNTTWDSNDRLEYLSSDDDIYYPSRPRFRSVPYLSSYDRYSPEEYRNCSCGLCCPETRTRNENDCDCFRCSLQRDYREQRLLSAPFNPFEYQNNSVTVNFTPPQTTQDKNQNSKNQGSNNQASSSNSQGTNTPGNSSTQNKNAAPKASSSGPGQPQRNNNNNNNNNKKKDTVQDYGELKDFIKTLKAILDRCNASVELREKILSFFNKFEKHKENFLRLLEDFKIQNIDIEDILSIVIRLFQSDYFATDIAYENFIALMEIVAKYIKDELFTEMVEDSLRGNKTPFDKQRVGCMKKVLQRNNILNDITDLFERIRKEIVEDNTEEPLEPDFSSIFAKVYHYFKHKTVRRKEWTVAEYFYWIRQLLTLFKGLDPEYAELANPDHNRREIVFQVYTTVFRGRFHLVVRAYGSRLQICTFFVKEKYDKKAKDGDKYVDGKKKP